MEQKKKGSSTHGRLFLAKKRLRQPPIGLFIGPVLKHGLGLFIYLIFFPIFY
jgi:hypothetical protein